jgi:hypothetical protein
MSRKPSKQGRISSTQLSFLLGRPTSSCPGGAAVEAGAWRHLVGRFRGEAGAVVVGEVEEVHRRQ